ncbi:MAG: AMP-binding protein [Acidobacteriota bacterium]|mgnify:FL=1
MLGPVLSALTRLAALMARPLIALRYHIEVRGLDAIRARGRAGILFLPNHAALIDPIIITSRIFPAFQARPLADEYQVSRTAFGKVVALFGARILPNFEREGAGVRDRTRAALDGIVKDLASGENILLYPSGRLAWQSREIVGVASGVETIVKGASSTRIVLVRHAGLWGSRFSTAFEGKMPDFGAAMVRGIKDLLLNGVFFMPRRRVTIEFVEAEDFPRAASRAVMNRYLEDFYNATVAPNTYVPYGFWESRKRRALPDPVLASRHDDDAPVAPATQQLVIDHLRTASGRDDVEMTHQLSADLGLDSLAAAELVAWVQSEFGFSVGTPESLRTVGDVVRAAAGQGTSAFVVDLKPVPPRWFARSHPDQRLALPPGSTLTQVFLRQAAARAGQPILADQPSGMRTYRDLVTAIFVLKPLIERLPGEYVGIMMPASIGATVLLLATMFAGKTAVMINWTTGVRTIRHSLESLGVHTIVSANALVTHLASLDIELGELQDRFLYIEDLVAGVTTTEKLTAAVRARLGWSALERVTPRPVAVVLFTSGSENVPKAVPLTHVNLLTNVNDILEMGRLIEGDVLLGLLPPFHSFGLTANIVLPLCVGMRTAYHANPTESALLARAMDAYRVSVIFATPTFLAGIVRTAEDRQLATLRLAVTGAEKCPDALYETLRARVPDSIVLEGYGITECSPVVSVTPMDAPVRGSIGRLLPHVEGVIVDIEGGRRIPPGDTGMLLVRGPSIFAGYLKYSGESPFVEFEGRSWYRTGDLVSVTTDGTIYFKGRLKRFIKLGGEMISLPAIESVLQRHFGEADDGPVIAVEAIGNPDSPDIVLFTRKHTDRSQGNAFIKEAGLSPLHNVRQVIDVEQIPVLGTGKTDYRTLKSSYAPPVS